MIHLTHISCVLSIVPVQNTIFTTEARRTQRSFCLSGGLPANAWQWRAGTDRRKNISPCLCPHWLCGEPRSPAVPPKVPNPRQRLVNLNLRETNFLRKHQGNQSNSIVISPIMDSNDCQCKIQVELLQSHLLSVYSPESIKPERR